MKLTTPIQILLALVVLGLSFSHANATPITVDNYSFENTPNDFNVIPSWTVTTTAGGGGAYVRPSDSFAVAPDGGSIVELDAYPYAGTTDVITLTQSISLSNYTPKAGDALSLSIYIGQEVGSGLPFNETVKLTLGSAIIATTGAIQAPVTSPDLTQYTIGGTFTPEEIAAAGPDAELTITLSSTNTQAVFDDVNLDVVAAPTPEPSTYAMLLMGLAGLALGYRRSKAAQSQGQIAAR